MVDFYHYLAQDPKQQILLRRRGLGALRTILQVILFSLAEQKHFLLICVTSLLDLKCYSTTFIMLKFAYR